MIWSIAWRNVWRNKIRSLVVILAVSMGMFGGTFTQGLMNGAIEAKIDDVIKFETSHIQIHHKKYLDNNELIYYINDVAGYVEQLKDIQNVEAVSRRFKIFTSLKTSHGISGVAVVSVDPESERNVTSLEEKLIDGEYFNDKKKSQIILSSRLAEKLDVEVGKKIIVDFVKLDSIPTAEPFKVVGIFETNNAMFDELFVFVRNQDVEKMVGFGPDQAHEIVVKVTDNEMVNMVKEDIIKIFPELDTKKWLEIAPEMAMLVEMGDFMLLIIMLIILLALSFGIINTMMMAVMERTKELGMLMAVGMSKRRVFVMIMLETVFLSVVGALIGMGLGAAVIEYYGGAGIDFSNYAEGFERVGYSSLVYPSLEIGSYLEVLIMVIAIAILACLYPSRKALKLKPVEALKTDN